MTAYPPFDGGRFCRQAGIYVAGCFDPAARCGLAFGRKPNLVSDLRMAAASLAAHGRGREAREIAAHVMLLNPGWQGAGQLPQDTRLAPGSWRGTRRRWT